MTSKAFYGTGQYFLCDLSCNATHNPVHAQSLLLSAPSSFSLGCVSHHTSLIILSKSPKLSRFCLQKGHQHALPQGSYLCATDRPVPLLHNKPRASARTQARNLMRNIRFEKHHSMPDLPSCFFGARKWSDQGGTETI